MHETTSILNDTSLWYGVALVLFLLLLLATARKPILALLDGAIAKVVFELEEAKRLRAEAEATLESYKAKQAEALREAEAIVQKAKEDAARLREEAKIQLQAALDHQEQQAMERVRRVQEEAVAEVRRFVIEEALYELNRKIERFSATPEAGVLVDRAITEIPSLVAKDKVA